MVYRPTWQGHLRLSLVTCPVALYAATMAAGTVHFNLINPKTNNRIKMVTTDPDSGPVARAELVKGYEVSKGEYIVLTDEEIKSVKLESTKTIDIERFVPSADIDRIYWDNPYYLAPDGKLAQEAFGVIRDALQQSGRVAVGRIVLSTRERMLALEPRGAGIVAYTLRTEEEVRSAEEIFAPIGSARANPAMIAIAQKIIEQQEGPFDPSQFADRYEGALKALIAEKQQGHKAVATAVPGPTAGDSNVIDLMSALRASLTGKAVPKTSDKPVKASATRKVPSKVKRTG